MVTIATDSTADLGPELAARYGIRVIPLIVTHDGESYRDGLDIAGDRLFSMVEASGHLPQTAAPSVASYLQLFGESAETVYIGISSRLSSSVDNARLAARELGGQRARIIDSLNLSTGIGLLVLEAARMRDAGASAEEIERRLLAIRGKVRTAFVIETMEYLHMGGRCTALQHIAGSVLHIRPIIEVENSGTMGVRAKVRGARSKALGVLVDGLRQDLDRLDRRCVFVTHTGCERDAAYLSERVRETAAPDDVFITCAGSVISSHCGPDTIGILYLMN